jgi:hypothetical protein
LLLLAGLLDAVNTIPKGTSAHTPDHTHDRRDKTGGIMTAETHQQRAKMPGRNICQDPDKCFGLHQAAQRVRRIGHILQPELVGKQQSHGRQLRLPRARTFENKRKAFGKNRGLFSLAVP